MKPFFALVLLILFSGSFSAQTTVSVSYNPSTGDKEMDSFLKDVNVQAKLDLSKFKLDLSAQFNVSGPKVDELLIVMAPGDVYMSLQVGQAVNQPVDDVKTVYVKNKGKGWGVIAKELGIKPGSAEFHALKKSMKKPGKDKAKKTTGGEKGKGKGKK